MWKKAMDYLGLGPDDAYDDYDVAPEPERPMRQSRSPRDEPSRHQSGYVDDYDDAPPQRSSSGRATFPSTATGTPDVVVRRQVAAGDRSSVQPRPSNPRIIPMTKAGSAGGSDPYTVKPRRFDSAQELADKFKEGLPVIMNLEAADREVSRRLIDFASGLCYGLNGSMEKVASGVYLLKPLPHPIGYDDGSYSA
ncbi:MAG: cell division protein SepF [Actinobacteria bacterium]|nr:cell division protein SepF [Actinomycetota bacterium]